MGNAIEYIYTCFTRIFDFLSWGWDMLNAGIDYIKSVFDFMTSIVHTFPLPLQGTLALMLCIAVVFLVFHR